jgi:hypothetical protein
MAVAVISRILPLISRIALYSIPVGISIVVLSSMFQVQPAITQSMQLFAQILPIIITIFTIQLFASIIGLIRNVVARRE